MVRISMSALLVSKFLFVLLDVLTFLTALPLLLLLHHLKMEPGGVSRVFFVNV